jgi:hypothetical protein
MTQRNGRDWSRRFAALSAAVAAEVRAEQHLSLDAVVAFVDGELSLGAHERAAAHVVSCPSCSTEVLAQRQARAAVQSADTPAVPTSLLAALQAIPHFAPLAGTPEGLAVTESGELVISTRPGQGTDSRRARDQRELSARRALERSGRPRAPGSRLRPDGPVGPVGPEGPIRHGGSERPGDQRPGDQRPGDQYGAPVPVAPRTAPGRVVFGTGPRLGDAVRLGAGTPLGSGPVTPHPLLVGQHGPRRWVVRQQPAAEDATAPSPEGSSTQRDDDPVREHGTADAEADAGAPGDQHAPARRGRPTAGLLASVIALGALTVIAATAGAGTVDPTASVPVPQPGSSAPAVGTGTTASGPAVAGAGTAGLVGAPAQRAVISDAALLDEPAGDPDLVPATHH